MSFYSYGLLQLTLLLFLFSQGRPQCNLTKQRSFVYPDCCTQTSNATIKGRVDQCYEQTAQTFLHCNVHAYIFKKENEFWCVDPRAPWLQRRLQRLANRGICCRVI